MANFSIIYDLQEEWERGEERERGRERVLMKWQK
jgi:hypothetical protein